MVKQLHLTCPESISMPTLQEALLKELRMLTNLTMHPNIVRFCGVCLEPPLIITEYYSNGSMWDLLQKARTELDNGDKRSKHVKYLSWDRRIEMLHDIAGGMMYLHSR